jgi:hypothetical protein
MGYDTGYHGGRNAGGGGGQRRGELLKIGSLWAGEQQSDGSFYLSGKGQRAASVILPAGVPLVILPNNQKEPGSNQPDYFLFVSSAGEQEPAPPPPIPAERQHRPQMASGNDRNDRHEQERAPQRPPQRSVGAGAPNARPNPGRGYRPVVDDGYDQMEDITDPFAE